MSPNSLSLERFSATVLMLQRHVSASVRLLGQHSVFNRRKYAIATQRWNWEEFKSSVVENRGRNGRVPIGVRILERLFTRQAHLVVVLQPK